MIQCFKKNSSLTLNHLLRVLLGEFMGIGTLSVECIINVRKPTPEAYVFQTKSQPDVVYLPLLNILRTEIKFRAEILHHLGQFSLGEDLLTFRDQLDLHALRDADTLRLTLVDHNVLPVQDQPLEAAVVQVIDHHKRERPQDER